MKMIRISEDEVRNIEKWLEDNRENLEINDNEMIIADVVHMLINGFLPRHRIDEKGCFVAKTVKIGRR